MSTPQRRGYLEQARAAELRLAAQIEAEALLPVPGYDQRNHPKDSLVAAVRAYELRGLTDKDFDVDVDEQGDEAA